MTALALAARPAAAPYDTDADRWTAVQVRDRQADGHFWYGVLTTGVYCRPHCPSRPARRENVRFFSSRDDARAAYLRACKRCRPDDDRMEAAQAEAVRRACRLIDVNRHPELPPLRHEDLPPALISCFSVGLPPQRSSAEDRCGAFP